MTVAGSSDYPCASMDPLDGIRSAMQRKTTLGEVANPEERLSLDQALALYTRHAATAAGAIEECGTLETGKRADLVVLDALLTDEVTVRVRTTYIGGRAI